MDKLIVILDGFVANSDDLSWNPIEQLGCLKVFPRTNPEDVIARAKGAMAIFTNKVVITKEMMSNLPDLRFIGVLATGYNNVDIHAARELGITVCNVPAYSTESVAQLVFALLLELTNRVGEYSVSVARGDWGSCRDFSYRLYPITELCDKKMGIIGFGNIGQRVAAIAHAFGMKVCTNSKQPLDSASGLTERDVERVDVETLFRESDVVSLNSALTPATKNIINASTLGMMKPSALLINTSRGGLVDEEALARALEDGTIAGAGVDVLVNEPPRNGSPLIDAPNCLITPHIAWQSTQARERLIDISADNLKAFMEGNARNVVN